MLQTRLGAPVTTFGDYAVPEETVRAYHENGFALCPRIAAEQALDEVLAFLRPLLLQPAPQADGMLYDYCAVDGVQRDPEILQLLLPCDYEPRLFDSEVFANAASVARALLGMPVFYRGSHYIEKPGPRQNPTPAHQDEAFWDPSALHTAVAVWFPLQDATRGNGALYFVPGGHREEDVLPHRHLQDDPRIHGLEIVPGHVDESHARLLEVPRGSASVHHCRVVHGAGPNRTPHTRSAFILNFATQPRTLATPRAFPWQVSTSLKAARRGERKIELP